jgi:hypothetical protein
MSFFCDGCGVVHEGLPCFFLFNRPVTKDGRVIDVQQDPHPSLCRTRNQCFVRCELALRPEAPGAPFIGVTCWALVDEVDYERIRSFFFDELKEVSFPWRVNGHLWNRIADITGIPNAHGTPVRFDLLVDDPTPYVSWVPPFSTLALRLEVGVTREFWESFLPKRGERKRRARPALGRQRH